MSTFPSLPKDILLVIFRFLSTDEATSAQFVSRDWFDAMFSTRPELNFAAFTEKQLHEQRAAFVMTNILTRTNTSQLDTLVVANGNNEFSRHSTRAADTSRLSFEASVEPISQLIHRSFPALTSLALNVEPTAAFWQQMMVPICRKLSGQLRTLYVAVSASAGAHVLALQSLTRLETLLLPFVNDRHDEPNEDLMISTMAKVFPELPALDVLRLYDWHQPETPWMFWTEFCNAIEPNVQVGLFNSSSVTLTKKDLGEPRRYFLQHLQTLPLPQADRILVHDFSNTYPLSFATEKAFYQILPVDEKPLAFQVKETLPITHTDLPLHQYFKDPYIIDMHFHQDKEGSDFRVILLIGDRKPPVISHLQRNQLLVVCIPDRKVLANFGILSNFNPTKIARASDGSFRIGGDNGQIHYFSTPAENTRPEVKLSKSTIAASFSEKLSVSFLLCNPTHLNSHDTAIAGNQILINRTQLSHHADVIRHCIMSPDWSIGCTSDDSEIALWDLFNGGNLLFRVSECPFTVNGAMHFSSFDFWLYVVNDDGIAVFDLERKTAVELSMETLLGDRYIEDRKLVAFLPATEAPCRNLFVLFTDESGKGTIEYIHVDDFFPNLSEGLVIDNSPNLEAVAYPNGYGAAAAAQGAAKYVVDCDGPL